MKDFTDLLGHLIASRNTEDQTRILVHFFETSGQKQRSALALLLGAPPPNHVSVPALKKALFSRISEDLFDVSKPEATDLSETLALLWPGGNKPFDEAALENALKTKAKSEREELLFALLDTSDAAARDLIIRIPTGRFRPPVSLEILKCALQTFTKHTRWDLNEAIANSGSDIDPLIQWLFEGEDKPQPVDFPHFVSIPSISKFDLETPNNHTDQVLPLPAGDFGVWVMSERSDDWYTLDGELIESSPSHRPLNTSAPATILALRPRDETKPPILIDLLFEGGEDLRTRPWTMRRSRLKALSADLGSSAATLCDHLENQTKSQCEDLLHQDNCRHTLLIDKESTLDQHSPGYAICEPGPQAFHLVVLYVEGPVSRQGSFDGLVTLGSYAASSPGSNTPELVPVGQASVEDLTDRDLKRLETYIAEQTMERFGPVRKLAATPETLLCALVQVSDIKPAPRRKAGLVLSNPKLIKFLDEPLDQPLSNLTELNAFSLH